MGKLMINLSAFGYEQGVQVQDIIFETWKRKDFIQGQMVKQFEKDFSQYVGANHCVAVSSCTSALQMSLLALGIGPGDEVITSPYTWVASAECIRQVGATPIFADINHDDMCINTDEVKNKINRKSKAIIAVDLYGNVSDIDELKKFGIPVIEDAAQSTGAIYKNNRVGGIADITCFSFYPTKNLSCWGDAGAVTTNRNDIAEKIVELRNHGQSKRFMIETVGWNARMDTIHAEVLWRKLMHLDKWNTKRKQNAERFNNEFKDRVKVPYPNQHSLHVYHQYVIRSEHMPSIKQYLNKKNIQARTYYPTPLHKTTTYAQDGNYPQAELASDTGLAIPVHQWLTEEEIDVIIKTVKEIT
jgi:dTDP-4-amino-4,6-dideoxygalactose transaminase